MKVYKLNPRGWKWQFEAEVDNTKDLFKQYIEPYGFRLNGSGNGVTYYGTSRTNWVAVKGMEDC